jgi:hypothetical protein
MDIKSGSGAKPWPFTTERNSQKSRKGMQTQEQ